MGGGLVFKGGRSHLAVRLSIVCRDCTAIGVLHHEAHMIALCVTSASWRPNTCAWAAVLLRQPSRFHHGGCADGLSIVYRDCTAIGVLHHGFPHDCIISVHRLGLLSCEHVPAPWRLTRLHQFCASSRPPGMRTCTHGRPHFHARGGSCLPMRRGCP